MSTLYELTDKYQQLLWLMQDTEADEQAVNDTLEALDGEIEAKADGYAKVIQELKGNADIIKDEVDRLTSKKKYIDNNIDRLKTKLQESMQSIGKTKFKTDLFSFSIQKNGGALPVIVDVPVEDLPDDMVVVTEKPDLKAIAQYLEGYPDCEFAHFGERGESLRIK